jgi:hypothetical protein
MRPLYYCDLNEHGNPVSSAMSEVGIVEVLVTQCPLAI